MVWMGVYSSICIAQRIGMQMVGGAMARLHVVSDATWKSLIKFKK